MLMPCRWVDGWPMLGDGQGRVPEVMEKPSAGRASEGLVVSDDFGGKRLKIDWQWNHNPIDECWSLRERRGWLRLTTGRVVDNLFLAPNTLTQRMEGPACRGVVALDLAGMKDGDVAGFAAFNGDSGVLAVECRDGRKYLSMAQRERQPRRRYKTRDGCENGALRDRGADIRCGVSAYRR